MESLKCQLDSVVSRSWARADTEGGVTLCCSCCLEGGQALEHLPGQAQAWHCLGTMPSARGCDSISPESLRQLEQMSTEGPFPQNSPIHWSAPSFGVTLLVVARQCITCSTSWLQLLTRSNTNEQVNAERHP